MFREFKHYSLTYCDNEEEEDYELILSMFWFVP